MNKDETLRRIARYLMLHTSHQPNLGLLDGKTGVAIFFFHYAKHTGRKIYKYFAEELINEIYKEIHVNLPYNFSDGLSGIAWGMEYLVRNRFLGGETDEVLEDLDRKIMERDVRRIQDHTLETGLKGLAYYAIARCAGKDKRRNNKNIPEEYLLELVKALRLDTDKDIENTGLIKDLEGILADSQIAMNTSFLDQILSKATFRERDLFGKNRTIGIQQNGYAGIGLKIMGDNETESIHI